MGKGGAKNPFSGPAKKPHSKKMAPAAKALNASKDDILSTSFKSNSSSSTQSEDSSLNSGEEIARGGTNDSLRFPDDGYDDDDSSMYAHPGQGELQVSSVPISTMNFFSNGPGGASFQEVTDYLKDCVEVIKRQDMRMRQVLKDNQKRQRKVNNMIRNKGGKGKSSFHKMKGGMSEADELLMNKLSACVRDHFLPRWKFLTRGWDIYSEDPRTPCGMLLRYLGKYIDKRDNKMMLWTGQFASAVNYKVVNGRSEMGQGMRRTCNGELSDRVCRVDSVANAHQPALLLLLTHAYRTGKVVQDRPREG